jgi:transcriptional antiterminator NusG
VGKAVAAVAEAASQGSWYVIHTYSGYENKVKANLEKRVGSMGMEDKIFQVVVPMEEETEVKDGKKRIVKKKVFPGYVLVEMIMNDDSWYVVRNTPGVTGFVGSGARPIPLQEQEVKVIMGEVKPDVPPPPKIRLEVGQQVEVREGPFEGFTGVVEEVHHDRGKVRVVVSMFGRDTPLELDFDQVAELE